MNPTLLTRAMDAAFGFTPRGHVTGYSVEAAEFAPSKGWKAQILQTVITVTGLPISPEMDSVRVV